MFKEYRRIVKYIIILSFLIIIAACGRRTLSDAEIMENLEENSDKDIILVINQLDTKDCRAKISIINNTKREIVFGEDYYIQKKDGDRWKEVKRVNEVNGWNSIAFSVEPIGDLSWTIHWEYMYGTLDAGQYRIVKPFLINTTDSGYCICTFNVSDKVYSDGLSVNEILSMNKPTLLRTLMENGLELPNDYAAHITLMTEGFVYRYTRMILDGRISAYNVSIDQFSYDQSNEMMRNLYSVLDNLGLVPNGLPPARIGVNNDLSASLERKYSLESAFEAADAVALVEIRSWLKEDNEIRETFYFANVEKCYKGDLPESITLAQDGCSEYTYTDFPLFTAGNKLLLFLNHAEDAPYGDIYCIRGSYLTVMDFVESDDGEQYFVDRFGPTGDETKGIDNYAGLKGVYDSVIKNLEESDPVLAEIGYGYPYVYKVVDVEKKFNSGI